VSFILIEERHVKAARKAHKCIWCGQQIEAGQPYTYERSIFEGDPQSHHWHPECLSAMRAEMDAEDGEFEFNPYYNERAAATSTTACGVQVNTLRCGTEPLQPVSRSTIMNAGIAQLVEHEASILGVASSSLAACSRGNSPCS
jgi:hypothetical protein